MTSRDGIVAVVRWSGGVVLLLVTFLSSPVHAVGQYGDVAELSFSPDVGPAGTRIEITGRCLYEGQPADKAFGALRMDRAHPNYSDPIYGDYGFEVWFDIPVFGDGSVSGPLIVPSDAPPGPYEVGGSCFKSDFGIGSRISESFVVNNDPPIMDPTSTTSTMSAESSTSLGVGAEGIVRSSEADVSDPGGDDVATLPRTGMDGTTLVGAALIGLALVGLGLLLVRRSSR